jgi:predicted unusual protein kinase regulating ubiquinone biosynthesis (AarF/ABC1/UbiB family)
MRPLRVAASLAAVASVVASGVWWLKSRRGSTGASDSPGAISAIRKGSFLARNGELARLGLRVGGTYASASARKVFASAERRVEIDHETELKSAQQVSERLGDMKGALMKLGQMASYLDEGLPGPLRAALSQLQSSAPPMSADLAAQVIERELGAPPEQIFLEWDPEPLAAASIGQVHRAVLLVDGAERAVAVKVQYPGVDHAIDADLKNADLLGFLLQQGFSGLDPSEMVEEVKSRIREELDYRLEARNQTLFAEWFADHPFIRVPRVYHDLSTHRVLTTELVAGHSWSWVKDQSQEFRDRVGETLFRFVFRSLYGMHKFNGDPHPGNYLFHDDGSVTFLDFGLVKHFNDVEMNTFISMVRTAAYERDIPAFRSVLESSGMLKPEAPVNTDDVGAYFGRFYQPVSADREITWTSDYASGIVRHTFDRSSPIAQYATVPKTFVFIQRINLGLYAILGELGARGNYRRVAEELWPFVAGPPSTELGELEARWMASRHAETSAHQ